MEIKLTVPAKYIAVLKLFAAEKDIRSYLNGIGLEIGRTESRIVATNGHILGCFRVVSDQSDIDKPLTDICIGSDLLKHVKTSGDVEFAIGAPVSDTDRRRKVTVAHAGLTVAGHTTDARYPDWRRVMPQKVSGEAAQFNPEYIGRLAKAWGYLHGKKYPLVGIGYNGQGCALIGLQDSDFIGGIMPITDGRVAVPATTPEWFSDFALGHAEPEKADLEVARMNTPETALDIATRTRLAHILRQYAQGILTDSRVYQEVCKMLLERGQIAAN